MGTIQVGIDDELKRKSDNLFHDLGTDTTTAIRMFLTQAVAHNGFPFEIKKSVAHDSFTPMAEEQILKKLKQARQHAADDTVKTGEEVVKYPVIGKKNKQAADRYHFTYIKKRTFTTLHLK